MQRIALLLCDQFGPPKRIVVDSRSCGKKKSLEIFSRNARHANGGSTGHLCPMSTGHSPSPFPFFPHPLLLIQAVYSGGVVLELRALQQPGLGY
eukprot:scaffold8514_cov125-Isochrysis_galbana.AAC.2